MNRGVFLQSLLIPGWGQYSLGARTSARSFLVAEILLISTSVGFHVYSNWVKDGFSDFAARHAQVVNTESKDDQYWVDIGNFNTIGDFNDEQLIQRDPDARRDEQSDEFWQWDYEVNRVLFEDMRIAKDRASERSAFIVAGVIANHIVSAIHALWIARKGSRSSANLPMRRGLIWQQASNGDGGKLGFVFDF